jgi:hypothetical protein
MVGENAGRAQLSDGFGAKQGKHGKRKEDANHGDETSFVESKSLLKSAEITKKSRQQRSANGFFLWFNTNNQ